MTRFEVGIPLNDSNGDYMDTSSLQTEMEALASDNLTHNPGQDTIYQAGTYQLQDRLLYWLIPDANLSQATTNFNNFIASYTFSIAPYAHSWTIA